MSDLAGKKVLLGVCGGISAYKVAELARLLVKAGADVKVMMTESGQKFVTPLTFRTLTGNPVATTLWSDPGSPFPHISMSDEADLIVVAPATANIIAKMAGGVADDLLSTTLLAVKSPVLVAPAMNTRMYLHPATRDNMRTLRQRGVVFVEPGDGSLACGDDGLGRMAEPSQIFEAVTRELERSRALEGRTVVITAGPTREHLDPVRFISNPSTGKMGHTLADRAAKRAADVVLISGPTELDCPAGVTLVRVVSADDMSKAVKENLPGADVLVMAAAVADFKPAAVSPTKIKKTDGIPEIDFVPAEDILKSVSKSRGNCLLVGFAAETDNVILNAKAKLVAKKLDLIVANQVDSPGTGFGTDTDLAAVIASESDDVRLSMISKVELADWILDRISDLLSVSR